MNMRILVTGGAGFIGSHLCRRLLNEGNDVICVDNLFTGSKDNISDLLLNERFEFCFQDVTEPLEFLNIDQIYNLACPASPVHYQYNPVKTIEINIIGAINVLNLAKINNARVLQASTSEVYGDPLMHPQKETYWGNVNPIGIRSCYDEGKRAAETLFFDYHRQFGVNIKVARIFNTYGPNMQKNDGRVVSNFIVQALEGENITIYGDGKQTRSFCYVSDQVDGLIKLMNSDVNVTGPINIGNPCELTVSEIANFIVSMTESTSQIVYQDLPADDPQKRKPDISLAKEILGWKPVVELTNGLNQTIDYFSKIINCG
jgi:NAD-dependent epimerase/dehydratase